MTIEYVISEEIFTLYPGYERGVVVIDGVQNGDSPLELGEMLRDTESYIRENLSLETLTAHPRIAAWREAYRKFGAKPSKFRSSIESLVRRALRGKQLPTINALVDIGNILSLRHLVPTGGHALDEVTQDLALRLATGEETFTPFGSEQMEHPDPGEVIFVEGNVVLTRRWTWRQAVHTITLPETKIIEFNVDGLPPVTHADVVAVCEAVQSLVTRFCGGTSRYEILNKAHPRMQLIP